jgi:hypothetical protein
MADFSQMADFSIDNRLLLKDNKNIDYIFSMHYWIFYEYIIYFTTIFIIFIIYLIIF